MSFIKELSIKHLLATVFLLVVTGGMCRTNAQYTNWWMAVGDYHNWYSEIGTEIEVGWESRQQFGAQWPAIYRYQDMQAANGVWIGAKNVTDEFGINYPTRVVHAGPRVTGSGEFFPVKYEMYCKFAPPTVSVDGVTSYLKDVPEHTIDENMPYDRLIVNEVNTLLGVTMERKIYQFSQQDHDDYHIIEVTLTNTGNTDADPEIELPNQTVEDVYIFYAFRLAICQNSRHVIGNGTGWGMNTMIDFRGDGRKNDTDLDLKATYAWHGYFPGFSQYDNIGGPIWQPDGTAYTTAGDTIGRLGASQFIGIVTLDADSSYLNEAQPSVMSWLGSDEPYFSNNDAYNVTRMTQEYNLMSIQSQDKRHCDVIEPEGKFTEPTGDPAQGSSGGYSNCLGYGPYTLDMGESVKIVWAEGVGGLSREKNILYGRQFKDGTISAKTKNEYVMTGKDSLFNVFRKAYDNYQSGLAIPEPPLPPEYFTVESGGDKIAITWVPSTQSGPVVRGYELYRAQGAYDSSYTRIAQLGPDVTAYNDTDLKRGVNYYYYIQSVGDPADNDGSVPLRSSRYYTQTYDPAVLKRPATDEMDKIRIVPNPFVLSSSAAQIRFGATDSDRLAFFNIPAQCTIDIYTELGEKVISIDHTDGSGDEYWKCRTSSNQVVVSGIYIAVITNGKNGEKAIKKFAIIR